MELDERIPIRSLAEAETQINQFHSRLDALEKHVWHTLEQEHDTWLRTPAWKRWMFILDGWSGHRLMEAPKWRPWRRWWTS